VATPIIAVFGATGRQGGAVARKLLQRGWRVRALTRRPEAPSGRALVALGAEVLRTDLGSPETLERALGGVHGVFLVTDFWEHGHREEVRQGTGAVNAALRARVPHIVFSSVGGVERTTGLGIRHFDSKRAIEECLQASGIAFTIFRPVTFLENFITAWYRKAICRAGVFDFCIEPEKPFQMVAVADVAVFVEKAFAGPNEFAGKTLELASDRCTMLDFARVLGEAVARPVRYRCQRPWMQVLLAGVFVVTGSTGRYKAGPSLIAQFRCNNASTSLTWTSTTIK